MAGGRSASHLFIPLMIQETPTVSTALSLMNLAGR